MKVLLESGKVLISCFHLASWVLGLPVGDRSGYEKGYVQCPNCRNLEGYWDGERVFFYQCKVRPMKMKVLNYRWRRCPLFVRTAEPVFLRMNLIDR